MTAILALGKRKQEDEDEHGFRGGLFNVSMGNMSCLKKSK